MELDKETRRQLLRDYDHANAHVQEILYNGLENGIVGDPDYTSPTMSSNRIVKLDDERGSLIYFKRIRDACEMVLMQGKISREQLPLGIPPRAPKYLLDFITGY